MCSEHEEFRFLRLSWSVNVSDTVGLTSDHHSLLAKAVALDIQHHVAERHSSDYDTVLLYNMFSEFTKP